MKNNDFKIMISVLFLLKFEKIKESHTFTSSRHAVRDCIAVLLY